MQLTIKTNEYEILKVPFESTTTIKLYDYDNSENEEMREILLELGAKTHKSKRLSKWYCENSGEYKEVTRPLKLSPIHFD